MEESIGTYKVLRPTNGYGIGETVTLTESEAKSWNANEPTPRIEPVTEEAETGTEEAEITEPMEGEFVEETEETPEEQGQDKATDEQGAAENVA